MSRASRLAFMISAIFLLAIAAPFVHAQAAADSEHFFGGFLLNPIDGNSYLAKMRQGYDGAWLFTLPYTAEPGAGAAINLYYLLLGHAAGWLEWGLIFTFHAARLLGAAGLCAALWRLFSHTLPEAWRGWAFGLALFGSGLGWLAVAFGGFTSDFWVAEAYPFLAGFANAHFPLGLALQIYLITPAVNDQPALRLLAAALLSVVYPFGWAVALAALVGHAVLARMLSAKAAPSLARIGSVLLGGLPYGAYALWVTNAHPVLAQWNAQNLTPAPALWDLAVAFSPALLLALLGAYWVIRQRQEQAYSLVAWAVTCISLVYFPIGLQRRFISGLFIPLAGLAVSALAKAIRQSSRLRIAIVALLVFSLLTNLLILLGASQAASRQEPALYLGSGEAAAYAWLDEHAAPGALVLAPEVYSLRLPAYADVRVWYGHPFETVLADQRQAELEAFFAGEVQRVEFAASSRAQFILQGTDQFDLPGWKTAFEQGAVRVLSRE